LHNALVAWAREHGSKSIVTECVPKDPTETKALRRLLKIYGYHCDIKSNSGEEFGFRLEL